MFREKDVEIKIKRKVETHYFPDGTLIRKSCSRCQEVRPADSFAKSKDTRYGLNSACNFCLQRNEGRPSSYYDELYRECWAKNGREFLPCFDCLSFKHKEEFNKAGGKGSIRRDFRNAKCKDCFGSYHAKYRVENRDTLLSYKKDYYEENKDELLGKMKIYAKDNREKIAKYQKAYAVENEDALRKQRRGYREENKELLKKRAKNWKMSNREEFRDSEKLKMRRVRKYDKAFPFNRDEVKNFFKHQCFLTGEEENLHIDHFIPRSLNHGIRDFGNAVLISGRINLSKQEFNPFDWVEFPWVSDLISQEEWLRWIKHLSSVNNLTLSEFKEFVYWCFDNPRDEQELIPNSISSLELWKLSREEAEGNA